VCVCVCVPQTSFKQFVLYYLYYYFPIIWHVNQAVLIVYVNVDLHVCEFICVCVCVWV